VRQWVLTLPYRVYARTLLAFYARTARSHGIRAGQTGTVTVIQRFGSGLQLDIHFHTLVLDGIFSDARPGGLTFHPTPPPSDEDVAQVLATVRARVERLLARRQLEPADDTAPADPLAEASPVLAGLVGASVQGRVALGPRAGVIATRYEKKATIITSDKSLPSGGGCCTTAPSPPRSSTVSSITVRSTTSRARATGCAASPGRRTRPRGPNRPQRGCRVLAPPPQRGSWRLPGPWPRARQTENRAPSSRRLRGGPWRRPSRIAPASSGGGASYPRIGENKWRIDTENFQAREIRAAYRRFVPGAGVHTLARAYGVSVTVITNILRGRTHIEPDGDGLRPDPGGVTDGPPS